MPKNQAPPEERLEETLGSRFRNARINRGKSLQEASQVTCINTNTLANLEADDFARMPAEVFTKGFVKLYAQYLGLDPKEAIDLYLYQGSHKPEKPIEQTYRRELLTGAAMASPLTLFKSNPRVRIIAILLTVLLAFYALGAILKVGQKPPDQAAPENELAKSLVDGNPQPLPGPPGEQPPTVEATGQSEVAGNAALTAPQPETQSVAGAITGTPTIGTTTATPQPAFSGASQQPPPLPVTAKSVPAVTTIPEETGRPVGGTGNER